MKLFLALLVLTATSTTTWAQPDFSEKPLDLKTIKCELLLGNEGREALSEPVQLVRETATRGTILQVRKDARESSILAWPGDLLEIQSGPVKGEEDITTAEVKLLRNGLISIANWQWLELSTNVLFVGESNDHLKSTPLANLISGNFDPLLRPRVRIGTLVWAKNSNGNISAGSVGRVTDLYNVGHELDKLAAYETLDKKMLSTATSELTAMTLAEIKAFVELYGDTITVDWFETEKYLTSD